MIQGDKIVVTEYFGGCPRCGENEDCLNVGRDHWCVCHTHKLRWLIGSNLFSSWKHEDESIWAANRAKLETYEEVDHTLPEGTWSTDPDIQRRELQEDRERCRKDLADMNAEHDRRNRAVANVASFLRNALTPVAASLASETDVDVHIGNVGPIFHLRNDGLWEENADDIPF